MPARGTWSQFRLDFRASGVVMMEIKPDMFYRTRTRAWCTATLPAPAVLSCCSSYCLFSHLQLCSHLTDQETGTSQWFSLCPHPQTSALTVCSVTGDRTLTLITHTHAHTHTHTHTWPHLQLHGVINILTFHPPPAALRSQVVARRGDEDRRTLYSNSSEGVHGRPPCTRMLQMSVCVCVCGDATCASSAQWNEGLS